MYLYDKRIDMCGRSSISKKEFDLEERFNAKFYSSDIEKYNPLPNYNLGPTTFVPVKASSDPSHFQFFYWGMDIITWTGELKKNVVNARLENILKVETFKDCILNRRCILPATSYFEWKTLEKPKKKIPYLVKIKSQEIFSLAGLWTIQKDALGNDINKFVLITQKPTSKLSYIHDRMPAILTEKDEALWLDTNLSAEKALGLINQHPDSDIQFHTVTAMLNKSYDNDPKFLVEYRHEIEEQGSLF